MPPSPEEDLNEYLAVEWDFEGTVSAERPFALRLLGEIDDYLVYEFVDDEVRMFAIHGRVMSCSPAGSMTLDDLRVQWKGEDWIAVREPVGLATSKIGDERVPSGPERRAAIERLVSDAGHDPATTTILEGVYLVAEQRSIAVVETAAGEPLALLGEAVEPVAPVMHELSASRQLSHAVGRAN